jgi:hypothetical protein
MLNQSAPLPRSQPPNQSAPLRIKDFSFCEKVIYGTAILTPLWWLLGIQPLFYPAVALFLLVVQVRFDQWVRQPPPLFVWAWLLMAIVGLGTAIAGLQEMNANLRTVAATLVTFFKSYLMIFACVAIPFFAQVRLPVITRAIAWMSVGMLANLIIQMGLLAAGVNNAKFIPPLARAIPGDVSSSLLVSSAKISRFYGLSLPRSVLHTADPPILGLVALLCTLLCLSEANSRLRQLALTGSIGALIISFSRSAWLGLIMTGFILWALRSDRIKQISLWIAAASFTVAALFSLTINQLLAKPMELFTSARASSSETRAIVVRETLLAWQEKFWWGWGLIRGEILIYGEKSLSLGSFSTYAAVLYLNGLIGFMVFLLALASTLMVFYKPALAGDFNAQVAIAALVVVYALLQATPLSWMAIYLWFFFIWLGAVAAQVTKTRVTISWQDLARPRAG